MSKNSQGTLRFDSANIDETRKPQNKKYGFLTVDEGKTPFPRKDNPALDPNALRERLTKLDSPNHDYQVDTLSFRLGEMSVSDTTSAGGSSSGSMPTRKTRREQFYAKRKKFYQAEYLIAKQRAMSDTMHPPLDDTPESWQIGNQNLHSNNKEDDKESVAKQEEKEKDEDEHENEDEGGEINVDMEENRKWKEGAVKIDKPRMKTEFNKEMES